MLEFVVMPIGAFVLALLAVAAIVLLTGAASAWAGHVFNAQMLLIAIASVGTVLLSERSLRIGEQGLIVGSESDIGGGVLAKLLLIAAVGFAFAMCVAWVFSAARVRSAFNRYGKVGCEAPKDLIVAFMVYYVAYSILPIIFVGRHYFHVSLIYPFFVFVALFLWVQVSTIDPVTVMKRCLALIVFTSIGAALFVPGLALQPAYVGLIPGFSSRLWGVTASANTLGSVASVLLVLEAAEPSTRKWRRNAVLVAATLTLLLTQSKTAILAALVSLAIMYGWRLAVELRNQTGGGSGNARMLVIGVIVVVLTAVSLAAAWAMFWDLSALGSIERQMNSRAVTDMSTATGRTWIWAAAFNGGLESPLFGQGADFWRLDNRLRLGLSGATHAHNLFLQAFSLAGLFGLVPLLVFLLFLIRYSVRAAALTRGGSVALMVVFLLRSVFEVPLQPNSILGAEFFATMAYFIYAMDRGAKPLSTSVSSRPALAAAGTRVAAK